MAYFDVYIISIFYFYISIAISKHSKKIAEEDELDARSKEISLWNQQ